MPTFITDIGINHYVILATVLFCIGLWGVMTSRNIVRVLMAVELMLSAVNINLAAFNNFMSNPPGYALEHSIGGQIMAIFVLTVSAAEAALGLAIVIALYRQRATVDVENYDLLKG